MPPRSPAPLLSPSPTSTSASSAPTSPLRISSWPARKPLAKKCGRCRLTTITAISSRGPSPIFRTSAAARAAAPSLAPLHFLWRLNAQQRQRLHQLRLHPFRQPQQECPFLLIGFRQDVVLVIKIVKRLRQLECILGQERRLLRRNRRIHRVIQ